MKLPILGELYVRAEVIEHVNWYMTEGRGSDMPKFLGTDNPIPTILKDGMKFAIKTYAEPLAEENEKLRLRIHPGMLAQIDTYDRLLSENHHLKEELDHYVVELNSERIQLDDSQKENQKLKSALDVAMEALYSYEDIEIIRKKMWETIKEYKAKEALKKIESIMKGEVEK